MLKAVRKSESSSLVFESKFLMKGHYDSMIVDKRIWFVTWILDTILGYSAEFQTPLTENGKHGSLHGFRIEPPQNGILHGSCKSIGGWMTSYIIAFPPFLHSIPSDPLEQGGQLAQRWRGRFGPVSWRENRTMIFIEKDAVETIHDTLKKFNLLFKLQMTIDFPNSWIYYHSRSFLPDGVKVWMIHAIDTNQQLQFQTFKQSMNESLLPRLACSSKCLISFTPGYRIDPLPVMDGVISYNSIYN